MCSCLLVLNYLSELPSQHIIKSLTVENIAYEVFSPFAAAFEQIRKVKLATLSLYAF